MRFKQYRNALNYFNRAIAVARKEIQWSAKLFEARSLVLYKLGEYMRAMNDAKETIRIDAKSANAFTYMANIMAATNKPQEALEVIERGLSTLDPSISGYGHMEAVRESLKRRLDPEYVPKAIAQSDPVVCLPVDINVIVFRQLDIRTLIACRGVSRHWREFVDTTSVIWSQPCFSSPNAIDLLIQQLPAYPKPYKLAKQLVYNGQRVVPNKILCCVFERSRESLRHLVIPESSAPNARTLDALFANKRPLLEQITIGRNANLSASSLNRVLSWCLTGNISKLSFPYCDLISDKHMAAIARLVPHLRSLDISGCKEVRVKQLFRAWGATLTDAHDTTRLENLYINDHPGIPELLIYSCKHRHFQGLRVLHMAIRSQSVYSLITGIGLLNSYFERIQAVRSPFPDLLELNMDGIWDAVQNSIRFESEFIKSLAIRCQLVASGLKRLSMLDATTVRAPLLSMILQSCLPTLQQLHLTRSSNIGSQLITTLVNNITPGSLDIEPLQLTSLDLSGCASASAVGLSSLIGRCPNLVYVNLTQSAADNMVLNRLTTFIKSPETRGLEVVILDTTDITGSAARDFAAACEMRFKRLRSRDNRGSVSSMWSLRVFDMDNCTGVGSDAVSLVRDLLSSMGTRVLAAVTS
ncbi:hypothetical protein J3B02_000284 [Coemansia erecta]|nr:hypothetical protein J3B02_000284 [Coemansia erecta]